MFNITHKSNYTNGLRPNLDCVYYDKEAKVYVSTNTHRIFIESTEDTYEENKCFSMKEDNKVIDNINFPDWKTLVPKTVKSVLDFTGAKLYQCKPQYDEVSDTKPLMIVVFKDGKMLNVDDLGKTFEFCGQDADFYLTRDEENSPICVRSKDKLRKATIISLAATKLDDFVEVCDYTKGMAFESLEKVYMVRGPNNFLRIFRDKNAAEACKASFVDADLSVQYLW